MIQFIFFFSFYQTYVGAQKDSERQDDRDTEQNNAIRSSRSSCKERNTLIFIYLQQYRIIPRVMIHISFQDPRALAERIMYVLKLGLEGLVLKDIDVSINLQKRSLSHEKRFRIKKKEILKDYNFYYSIYIYVIDW